MTRDRGQTTYGQLIDIATQDLRCAAARQRHPARQQQPDTHAPHLIGVLAGALAQLGGTLSAGRFEHRDLHRQLRSLQDKLQAAQPPPPDFDPRGVELDLVDAAAALRTATDLLDSNGPLPDHYTERLQAHSSWTRPRPERLHEPEALDAGWVQIADLSVDLADLAGGTDLPPIRGSRAIVRAVASAAQRIPRPAGEHLPLQRATPGWPLPLPRRAVPNEWDGRIAELSALAWRITLPPHAGQPHPVGVLRGIALIGAELHHRAAQHPDTPAELIPGLAGRSRQWIRIALCTASLHTPTMPMTVDQRFSLLRTRDLALRGDLDLADLQVGQTALSLAATYSHAALKHYAGHPDVILGPRIAHDLRIDRPDLALAALNRQAGRVPPGALDPLEELYKLAAQPVRTQAIPQTPAASRGRQLTVAQTAARLVAPPAASAQRNHH